MAHDTHQENLGPEEKKYQDLVSRGDDYQRIELYRWALHYYNLAKEMGIPDDSLQGKIDTIKSKIKKETRSIITVIIIAALIILIVWLVTL
jgi:hypothetical protein